MSEINPHLFAPVRRFQLVDVPDVAALQAVSMTSAWSEDEWIQLVTRPSSGSIADTVLMFVSRIETSEYSVGRLAGFLFARRVVDEAEIIEIAAEPSCRRLGIGQRLLNHLIRELRHGGPCRVFLEVSVENTPARALYAKNDFAEVGIRKGYYTVPGKKSVDAKMLVRDLAD